MTTLNSLTDANVGVSANSISMTATLQATGAQTLKGLALDVETTAGSSAGNANLTGVDAIVYNNSTHGIQNLLGINVDAEHNATGTVANITGLNFTAQNNGGGTATNIRGGDFNVQCTGGNCVNLIGTQVDAATNSNVTNYYGYFLNGFNSSGGNPVTSYGIYIKNIDAQTNVYGIVIEDINTGTHATNNAWNIWSQGAGALNVFEGWVQSQAAEKRVASDFSVTSSSALVAVTGLSATLKAGRTYQFDIVLFCTCAAAGGVQASLDATSGLTATNIIYEGYTQDGNTILATTRAGALATAVGSTVTTGTTPTIYIRGTITVNVAGNMIVKFAQNTSNGTASIAKRGSYMIVRDLA